MMRVNKYTTLKGNENIPMLIKESSTNYTTYKYLNSPDKIYHMMKEVFHADRQTEEICYLLCFDTKMKLQGIFEISRGTVNSSCLRPREIFMKALLCGAVYIILVHNHPSGNVTPSTEDIAATKRIKESGDLLGVQICDHIVIGDGYYSFKENELL